MVALVLYPLSYCTDFFGNVLFSVLPDGALQVVLDETTRNEWWYFWISNLAFHWVPFGLVWWALQKNGESWSSIGLDSSFFARYRLGLIGLLLALVVGALVMPEVHYGGELPARSATHFIGPVSQLERLFFIFGAFTAAVTEEVLFRGFALTRLARRLNPWWVLPITVMAFVLIHGEPRGLGQVLHYSVAGLAFSIPFILSGLRRLEILILVHFLIDGGLVLAP